MATTGTGSDQFGFDGKQDTVRSSRVRAITEISGTIRALARYAAPVVMTFFGSYYGFYRTASVLAGKQTGANIFVSILGSVQIACAASAAVGVGGIVYGQRQRKLRERTIKDMGPFAEAYEKSIDPARGSSGLTEEGRTRKDDTPDEE